MLEEINTEFKTFKQKLSNFINNFSESLEKCDKLTDITKLLDEANQILIYKEKNDNLKREITNLNSELDELEYDKKELERELFFLEKSNDALGRKSVYVDVNYLTDEYKIKFINEYINNYTPWEIEELFKNGKKYLN